MYGEYKPTPNPEEGTEFHIPGYNYCGPGTQVYQRISRGDLPINELDMACQFHDVDYMRFDGDNEKLMKSDKLLIDKAKKIIDKCDSILSKSNVISSVLSKIGISLPFTYKNVSKSDTYTIMKEKLAALSVKKVFETKQGVDKFLSNIGYKNAPSKFASFLGKKTRLENVKEGEELFSRIKTKFPSEQYV
jgi:hypothetical protein